MQRRIPQLEDAMAKEITVNVRKQLEEEYSEGIALQKELDEDMTKEMRIQDDLASIIAG